MADAQEEWKGPQRAWAALVQQRMGQQGISREDLARKVGVSSETIRNWLTPRSRVDLTKVDVIADVLSDDPLAYYGALEVVPKELVLGGQQLVRLRARISELTRELNHQRDLSLDPLAPLLNECLAAGVGCWVAPFEEGEKRFGLRTVDLIALDAPDALPDAIKDQLRANGCASQSTKSRGAFGAVLPEGIGDWPLYLRPVLNAARAPKDPIDLSYTSIGIIGTHLSSWATDVASLVSMPLGYGFSAVNLITRQLFGDEIRDDADARKARRAAAAEEMLANRFGLMEQTVWASADHGTADRLLDGLAMPPARTLVVYLRPTDLLHTYITQRPGKNAVALQALEEERQRFDTAVNATPADTITIDVGFPTDIQPRGALTAKLRNAKLIRSMCIAADILNKTVTGTSVPDAAIQHDTPQGFINLLEAWQDAKERSALTKRFA